MQRLSNVFQRFRESNLELNPQKCKFLQEEITYLGHMCSLNGVNPDERLVQAVKDFPTPTTIKKIQSFLGLANYYRQFIQNFARIASPLYNILKTTDLQASRKILNWTQECERAFQELKHALVTAPVLTYPDFERDFTITCDASIDGLEAVLEQEKNVVAYASRTLSDVEKKMERH